MYAASGTGDVYVCDLEGQRLAGVLSGSYHNSYVHCVSVNAATGLVTSGDENGCVCVWGKVELLLEATGLVAQLP